MALLTSQTLHYLTPLVVGTPGENDILTTPRDFLRKKSVSIGITGAN